MSASRLGGWLALLLVVCGNASAANIDATVRTPEGRPVEDAAVVLELVAALPSKLRRTVSIEQRERAFLPYLTVVQTGTLIEFPNRDTFKHHIYSFSPAKVFEIKLYAGKPALPVLFDKPGEVALGCNIHDWMEAYVLVVDTPYFAKTGADGQATISAVAPGQYRLRVWHPRQKTEVPLRALDVSAQAAPPRLDLTIDVAAGLAKPKPPLDADAY